MAIAPALFAAGFLVTGLTYLLPDSQFKIDRDPPRQTDRLYMTIGGQIIQSARGFGARFGAQWQEPYLRMRDTELRQPHWQEQDIDAIASDITLPAENEARRSRHSFPPRVGLMSWLFSAIEELLPLVAFFVVQQQYNFEAAVIVMTLLVVALLTASYSIGREVPRFAVASTAAFLVFSIPSIVTGEGAYFQVSDTILDGIFALILLGSWSLRFLILKFLFDRIFAITDEAWRILSLRWGLLFAVLAVLNEYVRLGYSEDLWAAYKLISTVGILLFGCYQFRLSARMRILEESNWIGLRM